MQWGRSTRDNEVLHTISAYFHKIWSGKFCSLCWWDFFSKLMIAITYFMVYDTERICKQGWALWILPPWQFNLVHWTFQPWWWSNRCRWFLPAQSYTPRDGELIYGSMLTIAPNINEKPLDFHLTSFGNCGRSQCW